MRNQQKDDPLGLNTRYNSLRDWKTALRNGLLFGGTTSRPQGTVATPTQTSVEENVPQWNDPATKHPNNGTGNSSYPPEQRGTQTTKQGRVVFDFDPQSELDPYTEEDRAQLKEIVDAFNKNDESNQLFNFRVTRG